MGGERSQQLTPWGGMRILSRAQRSSLQRNQHSTAWLPSKPDDVPACERYDFRRLTRSHSGSLDFVSGNFPVLVCALSIHEMQPRGIQPALE